MLRAAGALGCNVTLPPRLRVINPILWLNRFTLKVLACISEARIMTAPMEMGSDLSQKSTILPKNRA
jgi:hypothetical protein